MAPSCARTPANATNRQPALELRFLDVGQGDAILIRHAGKTVLVDAGETDGIVTILRALGVDTIDLAVASHNHDDHIGGLDAVLQAFPVRIYLDNGHPANTRIQRRVLELVRDRGVTYRDAGGLTDSVIALGDATLRVIPSPVTASRVNPNDESVALLVEFAGFRALLAGDSERRELGALLREARIPDVDVLKAPHHGSRTGVIPSWLARTRPEVVAVSVGAGNTYGLPNEDALAAYGEGGRTVLRTDIDGDIVVTVDGRGCYEVRSGRTGEEVRTHGGPAACAVPPTQESRP
jgi:beta-lactamase superfamily II metal-dependent hydrolase